MLVPLPANRHRADERLFAEPLGSQEVFGPVAQRTSQPCGDRQREPLLGPIKKLSGNVSVQHLFHDPLADVTSQFEVDLER